MNDHEDVYTYWLDGHRWCVLTGPSRGKHTELLIRDVLEPGWSQRCRLSAPVTSGTSGGADLGLELHHPFVAVDGAVLWTPNRDGADGVISRTPCGPGERVQTYRVHLPDGIELDDGLLSGSPLRVGTPSPTGDRTAWVCSSVDNAPGLLGLLHRYLHWVKVTPREYRSLWVSRLDGSDMREIGRIVYDSHKALAGEIADVQWLPDGRRLSFRYDGALWTVPAP